MFSERLNGKSQLKDYYFCIVLFIFIIITISQGQVSAAQYFVSPKGSDSNPGTIDNPTSMSLFSQVEIQKFDPHKPILDLREKNWEYVRDTTNQAL